MPRSTFAALGIFLLAALQSACTTHNKVIVPDTEPGDQLKSEYMIGEWCTNREETADQNKAAGFSPLTNVTKVFWRFSEDGEWSASNSGFIFEGLGSWSLEGRDSLQLARENQQPNSYQAQFKNGGTDLFLVDDKGQYLVLSQCD